MIDSKLLVKLVSVQSSFDKDEEINEFIISLITSIDKSILIQKDTYGNIYATKGSGVNGYKCIVSHTDTVHSIKSNRKVYVHGSTLFAMATNEYQGARVCQTGIGGDDRSGIYTCIKALEDFDNVKAVFFRFEESGCKGSNACNIKFFDDCNFVVQCDRKGNSDFITHTNGISVASQDFTDAMLEIGLKYGYSKAIGTSTDVGTLKRRGLQVSACNMSAGYWNPHTSTETIDMDDLDRCYAFVTEMFTTHGEVKFNHVHVTPTYVVKTATKKAKKAFSNSISRNFFSMQASDVIVEISKENLTKFIEIGNSGRFKTIGSDMVFLDDEKCPICGEKDTLIFATYDGMFYCSAKEHNAYISEPEVYKNCLIEDAGIIFAYDRINDVWMYEIDSEWSEELGSYFKK